jgi:hypothetical protein
VHCVQSVYAADGELRMPTWLLAKLAYVVVDEGHADRCDVCWCSLPTCGPRHAYRCDTC